MALKGNKMPPYTPNGSGIIRALKPYLMGRAAMIHIYITYTLIDNNEQNVNDVVLYVLHSYYYYYIMYRVHNVY